MKGKLVGRNLFVGTTTILAFELVTKPLADVKKHLVTAYRALVNQRGYVLLDEPHVELQQTICGSIFDVTVTAHIGRDK